jgi:hypothetical protein
VWRASEREEGVWGRSTMIQIDKTRTPRDLLPKIARLFDLSAQ